MTRVILLWWWSTEGWLTLAKRRGAEILAEVAGYGLSCDAAGPFDSRVKDIESLVIAAERTFQEAQCSPDEIEYISAHSRSVKRY